MALTNTSKTIGKVSTVLGEKAEETQRNMAKLMSDLKLPKDAKKVKVLIPNIPGSKDDIVFVGVNGVKFYFQRGKTAEVPEPVLEVMQNCGLV